MNLCAELPENVILPLAIESLNRRTLSTDATDGKALLPLRLVGQGVGGKPTTVLRLVPAWYYRRTGFDLL
jgi:hypothetical protein